MLPQHEAQASSEPEGVSVPDHELIQCIGRGSYGEVWLARNLMGMYRAVKVVYRKNFGHQRPFERELAGIKKFEPISRSHESFVDILHVGQNEKGGYFYYIMELGDSTTGQNINPRFYVPKTLAKEVALRGRLPLSECVQLGLWLSAALNALHSHGLVHRDVKPSNIIFVNGVPKLADIGLVANMDATMSFVGTSGFLPPEGPGTPQADIYSLGKVLYEISTGKDRQEFPQLPSDLREFPNPDALVEFNEILLKACEVEARRRYQSAEEMRADLELMQRGHSVKRKRAFGRRWKLARNIGLAAIVLGLVGASSIFVLRELKGNRPLSSSAEAQTLYEQAVYLLHRSPLEETLQAFTNLTKAVELDPQFVDAYYMMFEANFGHWAGQLPPHKNMLANFRWVADRLRALRPNSAQYHTVNSYIKFCDWQFDEAIEEVQLALKLDPKFPRAHAFYARYLMRVRGDAATAHEEYEAAERTAGSDAIIQAFRGTPYYLERNFRKAIEQYQKALQFEPRLSVAHELLGSAYEADKQYDKALDEYEAAEKLSDPNLEKTEATYKRYRSALAEKGPHEMWRAMLNELRQSPSPNVYGMARRCARLGDTNEVFRLLEKAYLERHGDMTMLLFDDCWDTLRGDSRFQELVNRMGLRGKR